MTWVHVASVDEEPDFIVETVHSWEMAILSFQIVLHLGDRHHQVVVISSNFIVYFVGWYCHF